jgi:hypothetical protein
MQKHNVRDSACHGCGATGVLMCLDPPGTPRHELMWLCLFCGDDLIHNRRRVQDDVDTGAVR